ncbi:MAG: tail fiber protein [Lentisphaeria bacterium]|nr:tail fiber protein [Lentisphaeria bacterium]
MFRIKASNGTDDAILLGKPDGTLTWDGRKIIDSGAGTVILKAGAIPAGYLECDGLAKSRTEYADLFAAIGTTYGTGDGSTTFNLPDLDAPHSSMKYLIKY